MTDVIELLRAHDPASEHVEPPPVEALLTRIEAEPPAPHGTPPPSRPRRRRHALTVALTGAAVVAIALLGSAVGGERTDVLAEARAAVAVDGVVVHTISRTTMLQPDGRPVVGMMRGPRSRAVGRADGLVERWSTSRGAWRELRRYPAGRGTAGGWSELAYADGVLRSRFSWRRGVKAHRMPVMPARVRHQMPVGQTLLYGAADPLATVRKTLDGGEVREAGETTRDGRLLLRLVTESPALRIRRRGADTYRGMRTTTTYLIDATTYAPVEVEMVMRVQPDRTDAKTGRPLVGPSTRTTFLSYERLPLTAATERLLRLGGGR